MGEGRYIQVGVTALRDPKTGEFMPAVPLYIREEDKPMAPTALDMHIIRELAEKYKKARQEMEAEKRRAREELKQAKKRIQILEDMETEERIEAGADMLRAFMAGEIKNLKRRNKG